MEPIATAVARAKTAYWLSKQRPSHGHQWHLVDSADRSALAGLTPAIWCMADSFRAILPLAQNWTSAGDTTNSPINLPDAEGKLNWQIHHVDGSVVRAHQHAAGAKRGS
jgi:hypothetical protein